MDGFKGPIMEGFSCHQTTATYPNPKLKRERILLISKITNFLFHSCGERNFIRFVVSSLRLCSLVISFNIIIFISSANYFVFPHGKAAQKTNKVCRSQTADDDNIKRRHIFRQKKQKKGRRGGSRREKL